MLGPKLACPGPEPGIPILGGIPGWPAADMGGMGPAWTPGDTERGPWCMMGESPERGTGMSGMSDLPLAQRRLLTMRARASLALGVPGRLPVTHTQKKPKYIIIQINHTFVSSFAEGEKVKYM